MKLIKGLMLFVFIVLLCGAIAAVYAIKIEPYRSIINTYALGEKEFTEEITVVQISDIQISENYTEKNFQTIVNKINKLEPDIFIFTGDLYENYGRYEESEEKTIAVLSEIKARYGKFAIYGNRDYGGGAVRQYARILEDAGIQLLENEGVNLETEKENTLFIGGLDDYLLGSPDIEPILDEMEAEESQYKLLLTHEPDTADFYTDDPFDLILSGHSHGGQVAIPFIKGITTSMAEKYTSGFYQLDSEYKTQLYVNQGIGTSHYPIRFLVPPEITVFKIGISEAN